MYPCMHPSRRTVIRWARFVTFAIRVDWCERVLHMSDFMGLPVKVMTMLNPNVLQPSGEKYVEF